jgi:hypothetical protein
LSKLSPLVRNGIIIAVVVVIALAAKAFLPTDANSLQVGQCFDPPTIEGEVNGVDDGPCTEAHKAEVFFVGTYPTTTNVFPTSADFQDYYSSTCKPAFNTYTGLDYDNDETYDLAAFRPTSDSWTGGDRKVICYAIRHDEGPLTKSIKKA